MPPPVCSRYPRTAPRRASSAPGHCVDAIGERGQGALEAPPFLRSNAAPKACLRAPTKTFQDALEKDGVGVRVLALESAVPVEGGLPLLVDGKLVGAVGVSGDLSEHDGQCAAAGAAALAAPGAR